MARGRMISKTLSTSEKRAALHQVVPPLAEFCQQLYPLLIAHSDDFGRLAGDPFTVKHAVDPTSPRPIQDFEEALGALHHVGLIIWYRGHHGPNANRQVIQLTKFEPHQAGLHRRTASDFSGPPGADPVLDLSEARVEERLAEDLLAGRLRVCDFTVTEVARQVRKGASYLDLVAQTTVGTQLLVEVKRLRVTSNAISQVRAYQALLSGSVISIVIGHGLGPDLQLPITDVLIGTYDDTMRVVTVNAITVNSQLISLNHIPSEGKGRELNGTEGKGTAPPPASPVLPPAPLPGASRTTPLVERRRGNAAFEGARGLYVPQRLHGQFVQLRNHPGADAELTAWYATVSDQWATGDRKAENPDPDMFKFWNARYAEQWPSSKGAGTLPAGPDPAHGVARQRYGSMRFGQ